MVKHYYKGQQPQMPIQVNSQIITRYVDISTPSTWELPDTLTIPADALTDDDGSNYLKTDNNAYYLEGIE